MKYLTEKELENEIEKNPMILAQVIKELKLNNDYMNGSLVLFRTEKNQIIDNLIVDDNGYYVLYDFEYHFVEKIADNFGDACYKFNEIVKTITLK